MHEQFIILKSNQKEKTTIQNIDFLQLYLNEVHIPFVISFGRVFFSPFPKLMCYLISIQTLLNWRKFPQNEVAFDNTGKCLLSRIAIFSPKQPYLYCR